MSTNYLSEQAVSFFASAARLDALSNSVPDLLKKKRFKESEQACHQLLLEYPEQVDGLMRWAETYAAQGNHAQAAQFYLKTADKMSQDGDFDEESITEMLAEAEVQQQKG